MLVREAAEVPADGERNCLQNLLKGLAGTAEAERTIPGL